MDVRLPQLAEGADSGTVVNLLVTEGQTIQKDQVLLELENQKAVAPIPSPASGTVGKIHVKMGDEVTVGQLLVTLTSPEGAGQRPVPTLPQIPTQEIQEAAREATQAGSGQFRSALSPSGAPPPSAPSVRKLARQLGIDLSKVPGSGRGERITDHDLRRYLTQLQQVAGGGFRPTPGAVASSEQIDFSKWGPVRREPLSPLRVAIGKAMIGSWNTIPHVTQFGEADITKILALKKKYAPQYERRGGPLTLTSFLLDAVAKVLKKFPIFNSSLDETAGELVFKQSIHLGIAVDTPGGLIVPVLREADRKNLLEISRELKNLAERTRERKISLEELQGATFSVSNQGWMWMDRLGQIPGGGPHLYCQNPLRDQLTRPIANNSYSQDTLGSLFNHQLGQPLSPIKTDRSSGSRPGKSNHLDRQPPLSSFRFREPAPGQFRIRENHSRDDDVLKGRRFPGQNLHRDPGLFGRLMGKHGASHHITNRINAGVGRLEFLIDLDEPLPIPGHLRIL